MFDNANCIMEWIGNLALLSIIDISYLLLIDASNLYEFFSFHTRIDIWATIGVKNKNIGRH